MAYLFKRFFGVFGMKVSKNIFYITITLILVINVGFLIYYAYHIPLHVDEAGWWLITQINLGKIASEFPPKTVN